MQLLGEIAPVARLNTRERVAIDKRTFRVPSSQAKQQVESWKSSFALSEQNHQLIGSGLYDSLRDHAAIFRAGTLESYMHETDLKGSTLGSLA